jgi:hypothetical protein
MVSANNIELLLVNTKQVIDKHKENEKRKGETFNVFSILKMERKENNTHSAFLAELLNPHGTHQKGNLFLNLFLNTINISTQLDIKSVKVKVEHSIGGRNDDLKTGGRIDIFIYDKYHNCISIENKIDAGDQFAQVERYCNYKTSQNTVVYLNKYGDEPSVESKGELIAGKDFHIISYKEHIINWLHSCIVESENLPNLNNSIKQYLILIKKMTNSMDNKEKEEMNAIMAKHFEEAEYIKNNIDELKKQIGEDVRTEVIKICKERFKEDFNVVPGNDTYSKFSQIWLKFKKHPDAKLFFGMESFSHILEEVMYVGILNAGGEPNDFKHGDFIGTPWWPYYNIIDEFEGYRIYFDEPKTLERLYFDKEFKWRFATHIVDELERFVNIYKTSLLEYLKNQSV